MSDSLQQYGLSHQAPRSTGFPRKEYWSRLLCPPPGDLPDPEIKPVSPVAQAWRVDSLPLSHQGSATCHYTFVQTRRMSHTVGCPTPSVNPDVSCGLRVTATRQCRFTDQQMTTWWAVGNGGGCARMGQRVYRKSLPTQFCCEPKTALKRKIWGFPGSQRLGLHTLTEKAGINPRSGS